MAEPIPPETELFQGVVSLCNVLARSESRHIAPADIEHLSRHFVTATQRGAEVRALLLDSVAEIKAFMGCQAVGIRLLDDDGNIPYQAQDGFSEAFCNQESPLSIKSDKCMCIEVVKGTTNPAMPFFTACGSFWMNGTTKFLATVPEQDKGETRNECNRVGYESVALVPIRDGDRILGLIHVADARECMVPLHKVQALELAALYLGNTIHRIRAEQARDEDYSRLKALLDGTTDTAVLLDRDGVILHSNEEVARRLGRGGQDIVGLCIYDLLPPEVAEARSARVQEAFRTGVPVFFQDTRAGRVLDNHVFPVRDGQGRVTAVAVSARDITDQRQAEDVLRQSEQRFRLFFNLAPEYCYMISPGGLILDINQSALKVLGYERDQLIGRPLVPTLYSPRSQDKARALFSRWKQEGFVCGEEMTLVTKAGQERIVMLSASMVRDGQGNILYSTSIQTDITERKRMEEAIERNRSELEAIYRHAPMMMCVLNAQRNVLYANAAFAKFTGVPEAELRSGRACGVFGCVNALEDSRGCGFGQSCLSCRLRMALEDTLQIGEGHQDVEYRGTMDRHGVRRDVVLMGSTTLIRSAEQVSLLLCLHDVTAKEEAENRLKQEMHDLERFNRLTVDREFRMVELKKEVNALLAEAGKPNKYRIVE